ncbi:TetR/AcrR family transcriptional regulator [Lactiplantibacillus daowaiensis]|uniref:TetR/AcrR family transcriptional regulator n=1 Tax=Lactiplantibacillus daowaiensis TaxID=2559918 RepID=A0ABW1RYX7_9LACO|nr:TetR/AcrR family transcriptional regulator [Lactiplantibacillus daowaiensis]
MIDKRELVINLNHVILIKGFQTLSMSKLAQAVNVSRATLYLYFKNKDDLVQAVVARHLQFVTKRPVPTTFTATEFLPTWLDALLLMGSTTPTFMTELTHAYPTLARQLTQANQAYFNALITYLAQGQADGILTANLTPDYMLFQADALIKAVLTQVQQHTLPLTQAEAYLSATLQLQWQALIVPEQLPQLDTTSIHDFKQTVLTEFTATYSLLD